MLAWLIVSLRQAGAASESRRAGSLLLIGTLRWSSVQRGWEGAESEIGTGAVSPSLAVVTLDMCRKGNRRRNADEWPGKLRGENVAGSGR